jgi:outer membrane lipoprotein-sorting protein
MKKLILLFFILSISSVQSSIKSQIVSNLISTDSLKFRFEQKISEKVETGECIIYYPKKIFCEYDDFYKKVLVSNGKSLLINSNRNNQYYRYSLDKTPLNLILDKEFIISKINGLNKETKINLLYEFKLDYENLDIVIYFDEKTLNLVGWTTIDIYQNKVETKLSAIETNVFVDEEIFDITNYTN